MLLRPWGKNGCSNRAIGREIERARGQIAAPALVHQCGGRAPHPPYLGPLGTSDGSRSQGTRRSYYNMFVSAYSSYSITGLLRLVNTNNVQLPTAELQYVVQNVTFALYHNDC